MHTITQTNRKAKKLLSTEITKNQRNRMFDILTSE